MIEARNQVPRESDYVCRIALLAYTLLVDQRPGNMEKFGPFGNRADIFGAVARYSAPFFLRVNGAPRRSNRPAQIQTFPEPENEACRAFGIPTFR